MISAGFRRSVALLSLILLETTATATMTPPTLARGKGGSGGNNVGWTMNLTSNFAGALSAELTNSACRMKFDKLDILMILKAPDWSAYLYNESNKNYCVLPYEQWRKRFMFSSLRPDQSAQLQKLKRVTTGKTADILGHPAFQIYVQKQDRFHPDKFNNQTEVWVAKDIHPPEQFGQLLESMLKVPANSGMPLRASNLQTSGKMVSVLDTYKIQHGPIPASEFEPLKGYRKVKDEMALMMDEGDDSIMGGIAPPSASHESGKSESLKSSPLPFKTAPGDTDKLKKLLKAK